MLTVLFNALLRRSDTHERIHDQRQRGWALTILHTQTARPRQRLDNLRMWPTGHWVAVQDENRPRVSLPDSVPVLATFGVPRSEL